MSLVESVVDPQLAEESIPIVGVVTGTLIGFADAGRTPLLVYPGQPGSGAVAARTVVDLHSTDIGRQVVLMFERGDPRHPIVMGCLCQDDVSRLPGSSRHVDIDVDDMRLTVNAEEQLVLRCGKASITLTKAGKVLIQGVYISSRSTGVNRVKGASVQIN